MLLQLGSSRGVCYIIRVTYDAAERQERFVGGGVVGDVEQRATEKVRFLPLFLFFLCFISGCILDVIVSASQEKNMTRGHNATHRLMRRKKRRRRLS